MFFASTATYVAVISIRQRRYILFPVILMVVDIILQHRDERGDIEFHLSIFLEMVPARINVCVAEHTRNRLEQPGANCSPLPLSRAIEILYLQIHTLHNATATLRARIFQSATVWVSLVNLSVITARNCFHYEFLRAGPRYPLRPARGVARQEKS